MANAFEAGTQKLIPAVLIYARTDDGRVLMIHRRVAGDFHEGKWNGLGGKLELGESPLMAAKRELQEESGLDLPEADFELRGVLHFPQFKAHKNEDWLVWVFIAQVRLIPSGPELASVVVSTDEGELHWIPEAQVFEKNLWEGDRLFLPQIFTGKNFVTGTLWYQGGVVVRSDVSK